MLGGGEEEEEEKFQSFFWYAVGQVQTPLDLNEKIQCTIMEQSLHWGYVYMERKPSMI